MSVARCAKLGRQRCEFWSAKVRSWSLIVRSRNSCEKDGYLRPKRDSVADSANHLPTDLSYGDMWCDVCSYLAQIVTWYLAQISEFA